MLTISISWIGTDLEKFDISTLPVDQRDAIEADSFWCLSKFLDCIQDNYIFAQLGIQEKVNQLKDLIQRIDGVFEKRSRSIFFNSITHFTNL